MLKSTGDDTHSITEYSLIEYRQKRSIRQDYAAWIPGADLKDSTPWHTKKREGRISGSPVSSFLL